MVLVQDFTPNISGDTPRIIGKRYQLLREIGAGNMGTVYEAADRLSGQVVALKQVKVPVEQLDYTGSHSSKNNDELSLAQEFKILASLRHPNIISVLDYGFDGQPGSLRQPYVTMELLERADNFLDAGAHQTLETRIDLLVQMLQALAYLHRRGVLHRDIKPKNVLVVGTQVKVLDFGLSILGEGAQTAGEVAGTPSYMAPELWIGSPATRQSDLYAVGVIAYALFAGGHPFDTTNLKRLYHEVRSREPNFDLLPVNDAVRAIIARLMAKTPEDRYDDAGTVIALLQQATGRAVTVETAATRESFLQAATFVGREAELAHLTQLLANAKNGNGAAPLLGGESGVGKSRLLDELRTVALVEGVQVMRGVAVAENAAPFSLWSGIVRPLALAHRLEGKLDETQAAILKPLLPDIVNVFGRDVKDAPEVTPQVAQERLVELIEQMLRAQMEGEEGQPLLLILEDLHWADGESLRLLARVAHLAAALPLLVIGSYRDDEQPDLPNWLPDMQPLELQRLNPDQTAELAAAMLGQAGRNPQLVGLLQQETEGNTFFLVEMVRALAEEAGELGQVGASAPLPMTVLTVGVQGIVQRRLNRVPLTARPLLQVAAVSGRELDLNVLSSMLREAGASDQLDGWLAVCADAAVFEVDEDNWRFAHNKLRDGVLADLLPAMVRDLHARVARAIETEYEYTSHKNAARLAYHWAMANDVAKEEHYAAVAGEQALKGGAYQTAQQYLRRALELTPMIEAPKRRRAQLGQALGDASLALGDRDSASALYNESLRLCQEANYRWGVASAMNRLGSLAAATGDYKSAARSMIEGLRIAVDARAQTVALGSLIGMADLLARTGSKAVALEYAAFVENHLAADGQTHYLSERLINQLRRELPAAMFESTYARGRALELRDVTSRILGT